ncbi:Uncharacterised protein [Mycobacteroides abscessus subsp. abscessus]|nr:Uncharacterised protein [Mycobacteroides abscessus subsp. abscessus]
MWVSGVGWIEEVIATPLVKSWPGCSVLVAAPTMDSELVRVSTPRRSESLGSTPLSRMANSSCWVPRVPAASTTWPAV